MTSHKATPSVPSNDQTYGQVTWALDPVQSSQQQPAVQSSQQQPAVQNNDKLDYSSWQQHQPSGNERSTPSIPQQTPANSYAPAPVYNGAASPELNTQRHGWVDPAQTYQYNHTYQPPYNTPAPPLTKPNRHGHLPRANSDGNRSAAAAGGTAQGYPGYGDPRWNTNTPSQWAAQQPVYAQPPDGRPSAHRSGHSDPTSPQIIRSPANDYNSVAGEKCRLPSCTQLVYYQEAEYCCDNHAREDLQNRRVDPCIECSRRPQRRSSPYCGHSCETTARVRSHQNYRSSISGYQ